ncbi:hypothetical protein KIH23_03475 [Flavobacterium sp. CYK-55]|uniref:hypothetical protein n=1 Tax=Flavobacterium sp. CYK-55 TaxID=2835529 RepID=UPI001BD1164C|nr:hypothetical protein [Flavobacterium sp. CYK-55]MBS7786346.1 hypothetical protein [Flavobacterium sp. CYK-55]
MKKIKLILILACVFMVNVASMCSSDDSSSSSSSSPSTSQVTQSVTNGNWTVTLYNESGSIHTSDFSGYAFNFASSGDMTAVNGSSIQTGSWSTYRDSSRTKMDIGFSAVSGSFESISEDWDVLSTSSTKIELKHTSGGDGSVDYLTFEKI